MALAACASPVYFATVAAEEPDERVRLRVSAMAVNSGLGGSAFCAARMAVKVGSRRRALRPMGRPRRRGGPLGRGLTDTGSLTRPMPTTAAMVRKGAIYRAIARAEDIT